MQEASTDYEKELQSENRNDKATGTTNILLIGGKQSNRCMSSNS